MDNNFTVSESFIHTIKRFYKDVPSTIENEIQYVWFWRRLESTFIDTIIVLIPYAFIVNVFFWIKEWRTLGDKYIWAKTYTYENGVIKEMYKWQLFMYLLIVSICYSSPIIGIFTIWINGLLLLFTKTKQWWHNYLTKTIIIHIESHLTMSNVQAYLGSKIGDSNYWIWKELIGKSMKIACKIIFWLFLIIQIIIYGLCLYVVLAWITWGLHENSWTGDLTWLIPFALIFFWWILFIPVIFISNIILFILHVLWKTNNYWFFGPVSFIMMSTAYWIFMWLYIGPAFYISDVWLFLSQIKNSIFI